MALVIGIGMAAPSNVGATSATVASADLCRSSLTLVCVTMSASGRSTSVQLGQRVRVTLSDTALSWSAPQQIGPQLLRQDGHPVAGMKNFTVLYTAVGTGWTTLQATAAPKCTYGQACPQFVLLWRTKIIVR